MITILILLVVNGIGTALGVSHWYASAPVTVGLVVAIMAVNYECKNILAFGKSQTGDSYISVGFGQIISIYSKPVVRIHDQKEV